MYYVDKLILRLQPSLNISRSTENEHAQFHKTCLRLRCADLFAIYHLGYSKTIWNHRP